MIVNTIVSFDVRGLPDVNMAAAFILSTVYSMFAMLIVSKSKVNSVDPGKLMVEYKFISHQVSNGSAGVLCPMDSPGRTSNKVRSKIECNLLCQEDPKCLGVNWKKPSTCDIYFTKPVTFGIKPSCSYSSEGELNYILSIITCYPFL